MTKHERQQTILAIIAEDACCRQEDLQAELLRRGIETTQATISRDIRQLGLVKRQLKPGVYTYSLPEKEIDRSTIEPFAGIFSQSALHVDYALNTVVVKCRTGMANAACAALDTKEHDAVVGTLAGDDTIFILMRTEEHARIFCEELSKLIR